MTQIPAPTPRSANDQQTLQHLFARWRAHNDLRARDQIFERNLSLARRLAARYWNTLEPFDDVFQVASIGLWRAVERFDPDRGTPFVSFAIPTILGEIKRYFRDTGWSVHVPRRAQELARLVEQASSRLAVDWRRTPRVAEVAEYLELSIEDVVSGLNAAGAHYALSLDAPVSGQGSADEYTLSDQLGADDDRLAAVDTYLTLSSRARNLLPQERQALGLRLQYDLKQSEIAARLGCSQMHVSRLLRSAARKLRDSASL